MMDEQEDLVVRRLFKQLEEEDRSDAPSFETVLNRSRPAHAQSFVFGFRFKVALAIGLALAILAPVMLLSPNGTMDPDPETLIELSHWESPTDFLLDDSGDELLGTVPEVDIDLFSGGWNGSRIREDR